MSDQKKTETHKSRWTDEEIRALALSETRKTPSRSVKNGGKCDVCGSLMKYGECQYCGNKRR